MRRYLWDNIFTIKKNEIKKFIPMFLIGSFVVFNFIMLRQLKDSMLMSSLGTKSIPVAKIAYVFPASIIFMMIYNKLSNYLDGKRIFLIFVAFFGIIFLLYAIFLCDGANRIAGYMFYTFAECWSTVVFGTCMWAFFNDICTIDEAKRFYVLISGAQVGSLIASYSVNWYVTTFGKDGYFKAALFTVVGCCLAILVIIFIFRESMLNIVRKEDTKVEEKIKKSSSLKDFFSRSGISLVFKSRYLLMVLFITLSYNFTIIVTEFIWKSNLEVIYPSKEQIFIFMGSVSFWTTTITSIFAVLLSGIIRYINPSFSLALFPAVFGLSTTLYFYLYMTPAGGAAQWIVTKISKYSLADPAKQMLYIPCDKNERYKAKSTIDIVGARGGKAIASLFNMFYLSTIGNFKDMAYYSYPWLMMLTLLWLTSAITLGYMFINYKKREEKL
jgi:AAA family ATP:ADP antiporter